MTSRCSLLASRPHRTGYHGPCHRGHRRCVRSAKRAEARARCRRPPQPCLWPWKAAYATRAEARAGLRALRRTGDRMRLVHEFPCQAGHWHMGAPKPAQKWHERYRARLARAVKGGTR
jgi:hypothetical protein